MEFKGQYLTYEEYKSLGGLLDLTPFNLLEFEARKEVDKYTFNRLVNLETQNQDVKLCIYALIEQINSNKANLKGVSSESTDGYSISYTSQNNAETSQKTQNIINTYLSDCFLEDGTPYLYRGLGC